MQDFRTLVVWPSCRISELSWFGNIVEIKRMLSGLIAQMVVRRNRVARRDDANDLLAQLKSLLDEREKKRLPERPSNERNL